MASSTIGTYHPKCGHVIIGQVESKPWTPDSTGPKPTHSCPIYFVGPPPATESEAEANSWPGPGITTDQAHMCPACSRFLPTREVYGTPRAAGDNSDNDPYFGTFLDSNDESDDEFDNDDDSDDSDALTLANTDPSVKSSNRSGSTDTLGTTTSKSSGIAPFPLAVAYTVTESTITSVRDRSAATIAPPPKPLSPFVHHPAPPRDAKRPTPKEVLARHARLMVGFAELRAAQAARR